MKRRLDFESNRSSPILNVSNEVFMQDEFGDTVTERHSTDERAFMEIYGRMGTLTAQMKNLSATGAFLEVIKGDYIPQKGDLLRLTIPLDSVGKTHSVNAEVIWGKSMGVGVCFLNRQETMTRMLSRSRSQ